MTKALILLAATVLMARWLGSSLRPPPRRTDRPRPEPDGPSLELVRCRLCGEYSLPPARGGDFVCPSCRSAAAAPR